MHRRWLSGLHFEHAAHYIVLEDCIATVEAATARRRISNLTLGARAGRRP
jgi:hypothetical protein